MFVKTVAGLALAGLALGGCGHTARTGAQESAPRAKTAPSTRTYKLGQTRRLSGDDGTKQVTVDVTALAYKRLHVGAQYRSINDVPASKTYVGVEVKTCLVSATSAPVQLSWAPWSLGYADSTGVAAVTTYSPESFTSPLYPDGRNVAVGTCVRGLIPFTVNRAGAAPVSVSYGPDGATPSTWDLN